MVPRPYPHHRFFPHLPTLFPQINLALSIHLSRRTRLYPNPFPYKILYKISDFERFISQVFFFRYQLKWFLLSTIQQSDFFLFYSDFICWTWAGPLSLWKLSSYMQVDRWRLCNLPGRYSAVTVHVMSSCIQGSQSSFGFLPKPLLNFKLRDWQQKERRR
jgi:hypothetical protein